MRVLIVNTSEKTGGAATYPTEEAILNDGVKFTSRKAAYDVENKIIDDTEDFTKDLPIFQEKENTLEYNTNAATGLAETNDTFDGLNEAVNRISYKLNKLTEEINGVDNIAKRPEMLDKKSTKQTSEQEINTTVDTAEKEQRALTEQEKKDLESKAKEENEELTSAQQSLIDLASDDMDDMLRTGVKPNKNGMK